MVDVDDYVGWDSLIVERAKQPTPQTFEELAELTGLEIAGGNGIYTFISFKLKNGFDCTYDKTGGLMLGTTFFNHISPQQAYEIISVLQRNIGG